MSWTDNWSVGEIVDYVSELDFNKWCVGTISKIGCHEDESWIEIRHKERQSRIQIIKWEENIDKLYTHTKQPGLELTPPHIFEWYMLGIKALIEIDINIPSEIIELCELYVNIGEETKMRRCKRIQWALGYHPFDDVGCRYQGGYIETFEVREEDLFSPPEILLPEEPGEDSDHSVDSLDKTTGCDCIIS